MPRFSFPVPGRRQKQAPAPATSPSRHKTQKIPGNTNISTDPRSAQPEDAAANWDARSTACISISVSSTISHDDHEEAGLSSSAENHAAHSTAPRSHGFEEESGVLPRGPNAIGVGRIFGVNDGSGDVHSREVPSITDDSSVRRKQSSSTIMSYYDKAKVPLIISQQTSNSAMAKGLPSKASSLLDLDNTIAKKADKNKKKRSRLDLAQFLPKRKPSILSPHMMTRQSPTLATSNGPLLASIASPPRHADRPGSRQFKLQRPLTRASDNKTPAYQKPTRPASSRRPATGDENGLRHLYQHYEEMSFRDILSEEELEQQQQQQGHDALAVPVVESPPIHWENGNSVAQSRFPRTPSPRNMPVYYENPNELTDELTDELDLTAPQIAPASQLLRSPGKGYSESVSSRHTRTSRASRRTSQSLLEVDLQQTSILSLSSDSEEEEAADPRPRTSASGHLSPWESNGGMQSPGQRRPVTSQSYCTERDSRHRSFSPVPEDEPAPPSLPAYGVNSRFSSTSVSTTTTTKPYKNKLRASSQKSRSSIASSLTANSFVPMGGTIYKARAITLVPAQGASYDASSHVDTSLPPNQPTPPLSPMNSDIYYRSSADVDEGSIRSGGSFRTSSSNRSAAAASGPGRFMAVTRQEEKLLAALRSKRARMRESIIAEFEEEQEKSLDVASGGAAPSLSQGSHTPHTASISSLLELHAPQPQSAKRSSISFKNFPMGNEARSLHSRPSTSAGVYESMSSDSGASPTFPRRRHERAKASLSSLNEDLDLHGHGIQFPGSGERMEMLSIGDSDYIGSPGAYYGAEPTPDLGEYMDFDDMHSGSNGSSESFSFHSPVEQSPIDASGAHRQQQQVGKRRTKHKGQHESYVTQPREEIRVHIVEEVAEVSLGHIGESEAGIPRPDSPIDAQLPLPRKKAVRISAVGHVGMEAGLWGDDG